MGNDLVFKYYLKSIFVLLFYIFFYWHANVLYTSLNCFGLNKGKDLVAGPAFLLMF